MLQVPAIMTSAYIKIVLKHKASPNIVYALLYYYIVLACILYICMVTPLVCMVSVYCSNANMLCICPPLFLLKHVNVKKLI